MSKILYEVYQNDIKDSESVMFGKWYARLKSIETLSTEKLAKHISEHGSVFTADVVEGVMKKVKTCLLEMLLESKKVKIAGLGTFYLTCECQKGGADKEEDFNVNQHLKALHIRFLPDQAQEDNLSSREFIKKADFVNIKSLLSSGKTDAEGSEDSENGSSQSGEQSGSEQGQNGSEQGNESQTVMAPEITGTTPFAETTSVSIQAEQGAEIRYTTDGSTPTAESTLYSEAFTLSDTATVKAISIMDGHSSEVASKTFTKSSGDDSGDDTNGQLP